VCVNENDCGGDGCLELSICERTKSTWTVTECVTEDRGGGKCIPIKIFKNILIIMKVTVRFSGESCINSREFVLHTANLSYKMPKLKKKSVAQKVREDKKRNDKRREDSAVRTREQEADSVARRIVRQDPVRRREEQENDTAAHRLARQDNVRRSDEQQVNTASKRITRQDIVQRKIEQEANSASHRLARQDIVRRKIELEADAASHRLARQDPVKRSQEKETRKLVQNRESSRSPVMKNCWINTRSEFTSHLLTYVPVVQ
jgi:hypothetical protein